MEEESMQKANGPSGPHGYAEPAREEPSAKSPSGRRMEARNRSGWGFWLLILLVVLLLVSSIANLVVSQRAYESFQKQVRAIEKLTQSVKDVQRSIVDLRQVIEQSLPEEEEPEEDRGGGPTGGGSI